MADNVSITPGVGAKAAADEVTYSGDTASVQLVRLVDVSGVEGSKTVGALTLPVSIAASVAVTGTFWQATQPVSGTITANAGTGTMAVSAASLPLPTGASTAANQTALNALFPTSLGTKTAANSLAVTLASDGPLTVATGTTADAAWASGNGTQIALLKTIAGAALDTTTQSPVKVLTDTANSNYETVAASASAQVMGGTGASGDYLSHVLIIPATTSPGAVSITDGAGSAITIFTGGASSVTNLVPFAVPVRAKSTSGAWKVNTGTNVSVIGVGSFT